MRNWLDSGTDCAPIHWAASLSSGYYCQICEHLNSLTKKTSISTSGQFMYWEAKSIEDWSKKRVFNADAWTSGCTDKHFFTPPVIIKNWFHPASINTVFGLSVKLSFFGHYFGQETFYACERTQTSFNTFHFLHQAQHSAVTHHPTPLIRLVTKFNKTLIGSIWRQWPPLASGSTRLTSN